MRSRWHTPFSVERWFWSYFIFRWSLESQIIWGCDCANVSDLLTCEPLKLLNIVICTDIHKDTHIGFQWIRGLRLKQLKKTHTYACTHSWFIFIASHKLTAGHWQSALCSLPLRLGNVPASMGSQRVKTTAVGQEQRSPVEPGCPAESSSPVRGDCSLDSEHLYTPWRLDLPVLSALPLPARLSTVPGQHGLLGPAGQLPSAMARGFYW